MADKEKEEKPAEGDDDGAQWDRLKQVTREAVREEISAIADEAEASDKEKKEKGGPTDESRSGNGPAKGWLERFLASPTDALRG